MALSTIAPQRIDFDTVPTVPPRQRPESEWARVRDCWQANHTSDPYRLYQQMSERGWRCDDVAYATGQSVQAVGDYLSRIGAEAGFGGEATAGRDVAPAYLHALEAARGDPTSPLNISVDIPVRRRHFDEDVVPAQKLTRFDLLGFTRAYALQHRDFARVLGAVSADGSGGLQFSTGARVKSTHDESGSVVTHVLNWAADERISAYRGFERSGAIVQRAWSDALRSPLDERVLQTFGNGMPRELPANELGERMRARYGTELATHLLNLQEAYTALKARYVADLTAAMSTLGPGVPYAVDQGMRVALTAEGYVRYDDHGESFTQPSYGIDAAAYQRWYAAQGPVQAFIVEVIGANVKNTSDAGFTTYGAAGSLNITLFNDESGALHYIEAEPPSTTTLVTIDIANARVHNAGAVMFEPLRGFVTSWDNVKEDKDWLDYVIEVGAAVVFSFVCYKAAVEIAVAIGAAAGTTAGAVTAGGIAGGLNSAVNGLINGNLSLKSVLRGAVAGALTAGLFKGVETLAGMPLKDFSDLGAVVARIGVQGTVQALMGGSFSEGAISGLVSGLVQIGGAKIDAMLDAGEITYAESLGLRFGLGALAGSLQVVAHGGDDPEYDFAAAFVGQAFGSLESAGPSSLKAASTPEVPPTDYSGGVDFDNDVFDRRASQTSGASVVSAADPQLVDWLQAPHAEPDAWVSPGSVESLKGQDGVYRVSFSAEASPDELDDQQDDEPVQRVEIIGPRMSETELAAYETQWFQRVNDAKVTDGTYDRAAEIASAMSDGRYEDAWRHTWFEASPSAQEAALSRSLSPPSIEAQRLDLMLTSPLGASAAGIVNMLGGDQGWQDAVLLGGAAGEMLLGGSIPPHRVGAVGDGRFASARRGSVAAASGTPAVASNESKSKYTDYGQARNAAMEWLHVRGFRAETPTLAKFGDAGKPIGMKTADGRAGFRVEYDDRNGAHINVWSGREKGPHFSFEGSQRSVDKITKQFGG